ncbi:MAG: AAA family ATPase [Syntrophales bacterium]|nr:AAA family ATPase [Syntrophales bacterium]
MYYEYWGLKKPPFDNVPDPSMYVDCHISMENAIAETCYAIEEGDECIAVIIGDVGLGKTLSLRMIIDSLDQNKYKIVLITNPSITFTQILQEIIGQLTDTQCDEKRKVNLLEIFNGLLFTNFTKGKKVLIFIDEANAIAPANLENLRLLTNMQGDHRNLFTIVLAGQHEFAKRLEHPKRANLFQRVGTYSKIDKLESRDVVKMYVERRLALAGARKTIFTADAIDELWEYSDFGTPRLINKIAKLCLKTGETNDFDFISGQIVEFIGGRFQKITGPVAQKRKPRSRPHTGQSEKSAEELFFHEDEKSLNETVTDVKCDIEDPADSETIMKKKSSVQEIKLGDHLISIDLPERLVREALASTYESRSRIAGLLAAETMKKYPKLASSCTIDPVSVWGEIRDEVLKRFDSEIQPVSL